MQIRQLVAILLELRSRKLGTGEPVYVQSLANKLEFSRDSTTLCLERLGLKPKNHGRWPAITVPDDSFIDGKLTELGHDAAISKPMSARVNGSFRTIKAFESFDQCADGRWRFSVKWHTLPTSLVYCTDLNESARAYVRVSVFVCVCVFVCVFVCVCLCVCVPDPVLQVTKQFGVTLLAINNIEQPVVVERFQMDDGTEQFQLVFADGARSQFQKAEQLDDFAKCLSDRPPPRPVKLRRRAGKKRSANSQSTAAMHKANDRLRKQKLPLELQSRCIAWRPHGSADLCVRGSR
jgi:hypothetical protein